MIVSPVDEIKNRLDIIEVIQSYIRLEKAGRNYRALCPFHSEKTPSFMVSPERQLWRCFGCGRGGSIFDFIMEIEGLEFGDALRLLAQRAGIELKKTDPRLKTKKSRLYNLCQLASQFFVKQLAESRQGQKIQRYLLKRGLRPETIKTWQIGYGPNQWRALSDFLKRRGYQPDEIVQSGLGIKSEEGTSVYDRFRDRIIFPIVNLNGWVVGFSGRQNPANPQESQGKYINTPNTLIYDKSRVLYGLDKAKVALKKEDYCVLVEGQMDVILSHQAGVANTLATSGTALTLDQLKIIKRYTDNLVTAFDMDSAGQMATQRGIDLALQEGFNLKIICLAGGQDPADYIKQNPTLWPKKVKSGQDFLDYYFQRAFAEHDYQSAQGKKKIAQMLLPIIKKIANRIEQAHWIQKLAKQLGIEEKLVLEEMAKAEARTQPLAPEEKKEDKKSQLSLEEYLLGLILLYPQAHSVARKASSRLFHNPDLATIFKKTKQEKKINLSQLKKDLPIDLASQIDQLVFKTESQQACLNLDNDCFKPETETVNCLNQLKKRYWREKLYRLSLQIQQAEEKKDKEGLKKLTEQFNKISRQVTI